MDEEALLAEMEVTGQAFDNLQEQNGKWQRAAGAVAIRARWQAHPRSSALSPAQHAHTLHAARLIQQLKNKEAASLQLMQDTAKGAQRERMLKVEPVRLQQAFPARPPLALPQDAFPSLLTRMRFSNARSVRTRQSVSLLPSQQRCSNWRKQSAPSALTRKAWRKRSVPPW